MAAFNLSMFMVNVSVSTSTKTAFNFNKCITSTVAAKVKSTVITSSPSSKSNAIKAICKASVPFAQGITCGTSKYSSSSF